MKRKNMRARTWLSLFVGTFLLAGIASAQPYLEIFGENGENKVYHFYIDESAGGSETLEVTLWPNEGNVTEAQLFSTLNNRDRATLYSPDPDTVTVGDTNYWTAFALTHNGINGYSASLPVNKCGSYDVTARYKVSGDPNWRWYQGRSAVVNVSDVETRDLVVMEMQANVVDATGDLPSQRSTFKDLHDGTRFNIGYLNALGVNCLWLQPFHPIGATNDCNTGALGSPYSIKNLFQVAGHLGSDGTRETAMHEFTNFVQAAAAGGVSVIFDVIFNHVATDVEIERDPSNPEVLAVDPLAEMRDVRPQWFSKFTSTHPACQTTKPSGDGYIYWEPAENGSQIGPAPADRHDFVWPDAFDLFWGTYSALGDIQNTDDSFWTASDDVKDMTEYYAYFMKYWIEKTDGAVGGFRCDFAQGVPRRAWQYMINKAKSVKPELYFVCESLDGGNIAYRAWKGGFDALNENQLWAIVQDNDIRTSTLRGIFDQRKTDFGFALILRGTMNHDQGPWIGRKWDGASIHSVFCAIDGTPQMYQGQELGYDALGQFSQERVEFGRTIPNIREYHNMENLWNDTDPDKDHLWARYADANLGRSRATVLRTQNQYYIDQVNGNGTHDYIFSVLKYETWAGDPASSEVVLALVNLKPQQTQSGVFDIDVAAITLDDNQNYNVRNLASSTPNTDLWPEGRTGADIKANGIYVGFSGNVSEEGSVAQYLKIVPAGGGGGDTNVLWIGNTDTQPTNGAITSIDDLWVDIESWPKGAGDFGVVNYTTDGINWNAANLSHNGIVGNNDAWEANLGSFSVGEQITFNVSITDLAGNTMLDDNGGSNYVRTVNSGGNGVDLVFVGNTRHWPTNGAITSADNLWIDVESWPVGAGAGGTVVYSSDGGANWNEVALTSNGQTPGPNTNDWWHVNLGMFPASTTIKYAVMVQDANTNQIWDNNGGLDFEATVNSGGGVIGEEIIWVGNTVHKPVVTPELNGLTPTAPGAPPAVDGPTVHLANLRTGGEYEIFKGENLMGGVDSWSSAHTFTGNGKTFDWDDAELTNNSFYAVGVGELPAGGNVYIGDEIVINFETYPTGAAERVTIVYSSNGGLEWTNRPMAKIGSAGNNDIWSINLGTFPLGATIQYAIEAVDVNTNSMWDNNDSGNFHVAVKDPNAPDNEDPVLEYSPTDTTTSAATLDVTLSATDNEDPNPTIYYTTDGSNPTTNSSTYGSPITVTDAGAGVDATIKAFARDVTGNQSATIAIDVSVNESQTVGPDKPYSTNPSFGTRVANGGITIDGVNSGEWTTNNLIAIDMANDDPRSLGDNWTMHEPPIDVTHMWASWDEGNLYLAWQFVDITDVRDGANAGGAGSGKIGSNDGILQWIVLDTIAGAADSTNDVWGKDNTWAGPNKPDYQIYLAGSLWQGYISRAVNGEFALDDGGVNYMSIGAAGITADKGFSFNGGNLWGVWDCDERNDAGAPNTDFSTLGHDGSRDSFYEIKVPLSFLGITMTDIETTGIGVMLGGGSLSAMDSIPHDETTLDTPGVEVYNSSFEWGDSDVFTSPFARIGQ